MTRKEFERFYPLFLKFQKAAVAYAEKYEAAVVSDYHLVEVYECSVDKELSVTVANLCEEFFTFQVEDLIDDSQRTSPTR